MWRCWPAVCLQPLCFNGSIQIRTKTPVCTATSFPSTSPTVSQKPSPNLKGLDRPQVWEAGGLAPCWLRERQAGVCLGTRWPPLGRRCASLHGASARWAPVCDRHTDLCHTQRGPVFPALALGRCGQFPSWGTCHLVGLPRPHAPWPQLCPGATRREAGSGAMHPTPRG